MTTDRTCILIRLRWYEMFVASQVANLRMAQSMDMGLQHIANWDGEDDYEKNVHGAAAEMVVAQFLDRYWDASVNKFHNDGADIGRQVAVRWAARPRLVVRPHDPPEHYYVLVTSDEGDERIGRQKERGAYLIHGAILGADAQLYPLKDPGNRKAPAHFVPASKLMTCYQLKEKLNKGL